MSYRLPPLNWLRAYEAAARHLSFTQAALELNLTQAAISKQVKLLEHHLKEPLFRRLPRSLVLTKAGEAYLPKVRDAFERLALGTEEMFGRRRSDLLTIRASSGFQVNFIATRLTRFFAAHPDIPLRLVSSVWDEATDSERYDIDIRYGTGKWQGFVAERLARDHLFPLCRADLAARLKRPADLASERLLHVIGYADGWSQWLKAAGVTGINAGSGMQFDTSLSAYEVAANGGGVALGRSSMAGKELKSGRLVKPFELAIPAEEGFFLLMPDSGTLHRHAEAFRAWLVAEAEAAANGDNPA